MNWFTRNTTAWQTQRRGESWDSTTVQWDDDTVAWNSYRASPWFTRNTDANDSRELQHLVDWKHLFDAAHRKVYQEPGGTKYYSNGAGSYYVAPSTRVSVIQSLTSSLDYHKDNGSVGALLAGDRIVGPLDIPACQRFNGEPAFYTDTIIEIQGFFDNYHSQLVQNDTLGENEDDVLDLTQPWSVALLARSPQGPTGNEVVFLDGNFGAATISGGGGTGLIDLSCWNSFNPGGTGGFLYSDHNNSPNRTFLIIATIDDVDSRLITMYRDTNGDLQVSDNTGPTNEGFNDPASQQHQGASYTTYKRFEGYKQGHFTEAEIASIKDWAALRMPAEAEIPIELY